MTQPRAIIFDLGGTLVEWPNDDPAPRWRLAHDRLIHGYTHLDWPEREQFVQAMVAAERAHWARVVEEQWSGPPSGLVHDGLARQHRHADEQSLLAVLDAYAGAIEGFSVVCPDAVETLTVLRRQSYHCGLLSNTWWAAEWHNAELAAHGLASFFDEVIYTSDLPHSKPHPAVFLVAVENMAR